jgi:hypothetical protein
MYIYGVEKARCTNPGLLKLRKNQGYEISTATPYGVAVSTNKCFDNATGDFNTQISRQNIFCNPLEKGFNAELYLAAELLVFYSNYYRSGYTKGKGGRAEAVK